MKNLSLLIVGLLVGVLAVSGFTIFKIQKSEPEKVAAKIQPAYEFSIEAAPTESIKGTIMKRQGEILWESRIATEPAALTENVLIKQGERLVTGDNGTVTVDFPKVGLISLNEDADLSFIQALPVDFVVQQKKGLVKYEIQGDVPLSIRIRSGLVTKASGTIEITVTEDDSLIYISPVEGTATIGFNDLDFVSQVFTLREGETYEYNSDERTAINTKNK
jgi:hypothetical protein